jgi:hypothetical protein
VPVAIERPDGRIVDALPEAGHVVVPVSPNTIKTWREGELLSGAKSDVGDAAVTAEYVRLRCHRPRTAIPFSAETKALRTVVRTRGDLVRMRVAATNQLAESSSLLALVDPVNGRPPGPWSRPTCATGASSTPSFRHIYQPQTSESDARRPTSRFRLLLFPKTIHKGRHRPRTKRRESAGSGFQSMAAHRNRGFKSK